MRSVPDPEQDVGDPPSDLGDTDETGLVHDRADGDVRQFDLRRAQRVAQRDALL